MTSNFFSEGKYHFEQVNGEPSFYNILMKLKIYNITEADFGTYRCLAKNSQGETSGEISLYGNFTVVGSKHVLDCCTLIAQLVSLKNCTFQKHQSLRPQLLLTLITVLTGLHQASKTKPLT